MSALDMLSTEALAELVGPQCRMNRERADLLVALVAERHLVPAFASRENAVGEALERRRRHAIEQQHLVTAPHAHFVLGTARRHVRHVQVR
jgi:hypothetical protein